MTVKTKARMTYITNDEIRFLDRLGGPTSQESPQIPKTEMLRSYILAAAIRQNWGEIDPRKAIEYAFDLYNLSFDDGLEKKWVESNTKNFRSLKAAQAPEQPLPSDLEAERSIIGAILIDEVRHDRNTAFDTAAEFVQVSDFFRYAHRRIFETMFNLNKQGEATDLVTLKDAMVQSGNLDDVGGGAYIAALYDGALHTTDVEHYARIVKEKAVLRNIIESSSRILGMAFRAEDDSHAVLDQAEQELASITEGQLVKKAKARKQKTKAKRKA